MTDRKRWQEHQDRWEAQRLRPALERAPERKPRFITQSGVEIERVYTPADLHDPANDHDAGRPLPAHPTGLIGENVWRAQRHGLEGGLIHLDRGIVRPTTEASPP